MSKAYTNYRSTKTPAPSKPKDKDEIAMVGGDPPDKPKPKKTDKYS